MKQDWNEGYEICEGMTSAEREPERVIAGKNRMAVFREMTARWGREESGVILVLAAIGMTFMLGCAALAVDLGAAYRAKIKVQTAADQAALAAAPYLQEPTDVDAVAREFAGQNGMKSDEVTVTVPYGGDRTKLEVVCQRNVKYGFARALGFKDVTVTGRAVGSADPFYDGESLPLLNLDQYYIGYTITVWNKKQSGYFCSIWKDDLVRTNFGEDMAVLWEDGITLTNGKVANIKDYVQTLYDRKQEGYYIFSLSNEAIDSGRYKDIINLQVVPVKDLVLLRVSFDDYTKMVMTLTVREVYSLDPDSLPDEFMYGMECDSKLLE